MIFVRPRENVFAGGCPPDRKSCVQSVRLPQKVGDPQGGTLLSMAPSSIPEHCSPLLLAGYYGTIETEI